MALMRAVLTLLALCSFLLGFASLGSLLLRKLGFRMSSDREQLLVSSAIGLLGTETLLFLIEYTQHIRFGCFVMAGVLGALVLWEWKTIWGQLRNSFTEIAAATPTSRLLAIFVGGVAAVEFLVSQAPLTGSDALNYHFAFQKLVLEYGFHPVFSNFPSFLCGQHHLLILFGLALQGPRLALGLIFLGGILTVLSLAQGISRWASGTMTATFSLLFLLTPVIFWQISVSGAPDIFMAFLAITAVMVLSEEQQPKAWPQAVVAGFLVGGIAGGKYTGILIAAAFLITMAGEFRSLILASSFAAASLLSGVWPYLRNTLWTKDPVFPFLSAKLAPHLVTKLGMAALAAETGGASAHGLSRLMPFLFIAAAQGRNAGLWDFFGPLVLALAPLILLAFHNTRAWRIALPVWFLSALGIFYGSGLPRFLLPIFPVALTCVAAGWEACRHRGWKIANATATCLAICLAFAGTVGLAKYSARSVLAAAGALSEKTYLEESSADYQIVEAVNNLLRGQNRDLRVLTFIRHVYYLEVPYINGDPGNSFAVDPDVLQTAEAWKRFFEENRIGFVLRSPEYPKVIARPLQQMELQGDLQPFARTEVQDFSGNRIQGVRTTLPVVLLKVKR